MLGLLELGSRLLLPKPLENVAVTTNLISDHILHHKWKPNTVFVERRSTPYTIYVNGESWLARRNIPIKKPDNTIRIFYVGDSNTQSPVKEDAKMATIVGKRLSEKFKGKKRIEVINTGTSSWSPSIYYLEIKDYILKYSPDIVIIDVDMTDAINDYDYRKLTTFDDNHLPIKVDPFVKNAKPAPKTSQLQQNLNRIRTFLNKNSTFYYYFEKTALSLKHGFKKETNLENYLIVSEENKSANWLSNNWNGQIQKNVDYSMFLIASTIKLLQENNVKVIITGVPHYPQFTGEWSARPHEELRKTTEKNGGLFLNTYEAVRKTGDNKKIRTYYWDEDPTHFNEVGNAVWAKIQLDFLLDPKNKLF